MNRAWRPGDVALVDSWRGVAQIAFRCERILGQPVWCVLDETDSRGLEDHEVTAARPAVVIDPEDREQVERLLGAYLDRGFRSTPKDAPIRTTGIDYLQAALREFANPTPPEPAPIEDRPIVHAVMYRDYKIGSLCNSGAWGAATLFSMVTDDVTCPGCRNKLDGGPMGVTQ